MKYRSLLRCDGYHTGLNGVKIDDDPDKYSCFFDYPKKCYIDILSPFMDYSRFIGDCKTIRDLTQQKKYFTYYLLDHQFYEKTTRFGFPITTTEYYSLRTQDDIKHFNERVTGNIIDMDRYDRIPENYSKPLKPEVLLEFNKDNIGEITIEINKNEELAEERKNVGEMFKSKFDNVLFIFIDSLSREHFRRKLKNYCILSPCIFDSNYCKEEKNWKKRSSPRGGKEYEPPQGWYGIGLKIKNKYRSNNDAWLGNKNKEGEWAVAYHGIQKGKRNIFDKILKIMNGDLSEEIGKTYRYERNKEKNNDKYPNCGDGVILFPSIEDTEKYAEKTSLGYFNLKIQFAFMTRVNTN